MGPLSSSGRHRDPLETSLRRPTGVTGEDLDEVLRFGVCVWPGILPDRLPEFRSVVESDRSGEGSSQDLVPRPGSRVSWTDDGVKGVDSYLGRSGQTSRLELVQWGLQGSFRSGPQHPARVSSSVSTIRRRTTRPRTWVGEGRSLGSGAVVGEGFGP